MPRRKNPEAEPTPGLAPDPAQQQARDTALRILGRREHSAAQLRRKLASRGHGERAAAIIGDLAEAGWQSDTRFAGMLARSRAAQGYGPLRIRAELAAAGVTDAGAGAALAALEWDFAEAACQLHARRYGEAPAGAADWQKRYRFLAGRGFESGQIRAALKSGPDHD